MFSSLSRRHFMIGGVSLLPALSLFVGKNFVKWEGTCYLNQEMSWKEFCGLHSQLMDVEYLNQLERKMLQQGDMNLAYTKFAGNSVTWTYIFKDQQAQDDWARLSLKGIRPTIFNSFRYEQWTSVVPFEKVNWLHPYLVVG